MYNKSCFETTYLSENVMNLLKQKVAKSVAISFGYFIYNDPLKVAQLTENCPNHDFLG